MRIRRIMITCTMITCIVALWTALSVRGQDEFLLLDTRVSATRPSEEIQLLREIRERLAEIEIELREIKQALRTAELQKQNNGK